MRDEVVDFVRGLTEKTELPQKQVVAWLGTARQVLRLEEALREGQRAQRVDPS